VGCLCTFPDHDELSKTLTNERVRLLAYLGAAVVMGQNGQLKTPYIPSCLPEWIRSEIDRNIKN
jgi:hypothetical protein